MEQKVLRVSTMVVVGALLLRLLSVFAPYLSSNAAGIILFLQTGRILRPGAITFQPETTEPTQPAPTEPPVVIAPILPVFSESDASALAINCGFSYSADVPGLLTKPLSWDLTQDGPAVLIIHSHGSESYAPTGDYAEVSPYHTLSNDYNMISVGKTVAGLLEAAGISVLHDTALHDQPSYNDSYNNSRASIQAYLEKYPTIRLVLDLHRDSIEDANGNQVAQTVFAGDQTYAPLMLVVGSNYGGLEHPNWQENLALALKIQIQLEGLCPGICRKLNLRSQRFNQDLSPGALLVEVGTSGNSHTEALRSAEILAGAIISLAYGSG